MFKKLATYLLLIVLSASAAIAYAEGGNTFGENTTNGGEGKGKCCSSLSTDFD